MPVLSLASGASFVHGCSFHHFIIIIILSRRAGSARAEIWACRAPARRAQCLPRAHARGGLLVAVVDLQVDRQHPALQHCVCMRGTPNVKSSR